MHVFIPVFFNAPLGGLQSQVLAQAKALLADGHHSTIMCKPGQFADSLRALEVNLLESSFESVEDAVEQALAAGSFDLVHAHPFVSRKVGLEVARRMKRPFVLTLHGMYTDSVSSYSKEVSLLITVSQAIRDHVVASGAMDPRRVVTIPNAVDTKLFYPRRLSFAGVCELLPEKQRTFFKADDRRLLFVSRLDSDKEFILDIIKETWNEFLRTQAYSLKWLVAGDGKLRDELEAFAEDINRKAKTPVIAFLGWQSEERLSEFYNSCHLCVAPGRCAMDAMACGVPVIAVGSKDYVGLLDEEQVFQGMYGNFGGYGQQHQDYSSGCMAQQIDQVNYNDGELNRLGDLLRQVINAYYRQSYQDRRLMGYYAMLQSPGSASDDTGWAQKERIRSELAFIDTDCPQNLSRRWAVMKPLKPSGKRAITITDQQNLCVDFCLEADDRFYIATESSNFKKPPNDTRLWQVKSNQALELWVVMKTQEGSPVVQTWFIDFDEKKRLSHTVHLLQDGLNKIEHATSLHARSFRIAIRFSGAGKVLLEPLRWREREEKSLPTKCLQQRDTQVSDFASYNGQNLVFIVGPPRSGTTWVLNLLKEHLQVVAATLDNLQARQSDAPTLETNVFNSNRPFTDQQIKYKFHELSKLHSQKVIVEKTLIHLLFVKRIRRIFPKAALILTERDGRDVATSLIHVGRDSNAWWKGAPDTVEKTAILWKKYADAGLACSSRLQPLTIRYERLLQDPREEIRPVLEKLGLSLDYLDEQIAACRNGQNIPIKGVFREGKTGSWVSHFSKDDVATFKRIAGDTLKRLGYVSDDSW